MNEISNDTQTFDPSILSDEWQLQEQVVDESMKPLPNIQDCEYVQKIEKASKLHILKEPYLRKAFTENQEYGLFSTFFTKSLMKCILNWTNEKLKTTIELIDMKTITSLELEAYIGLEMAMSIIQLNDMKDYWSTKMFLGCEMFTKTMARDRFLAIRSRIQIKVPGTYTHDQSHTDPLWMFRSLMNSFLKNSTSIAVGTGALALDENTVRTKARTKARSYIPSKPDPYGIRFYALCVWKYGYLFNFFDNNSGNTTGISQPLRYTDMFRNLRTPYERFFTENRECGIDKDSASALWMLQLGHCTKVLKDPCGKRWFFTDNFYTRHLLANGLNTFTNGEGKLIGTIKFNTVNGINRPGLKTAYAKLEKAARGSWCLVRAYNTNKSIENIRKKQRALFFPGDDSIAKDSGYIVMKDSKIVTFYTNDLSKTPPAHVCGYGSSLSEMNLAIVAVNGVGKISR